MKCALAIEAIGLPERLQRLRWCLVGEFSLRLGDEENFSAAVTGLRAGNPTDIAASLLEIRRERKAAENEEVVHDRLRVLANSFPAGPDMVSRYFLAEELRNQGLPEEASRLLEGYVDLTRPSPATPLYLQSLAAARRDDAFRAALAQAAPEMRDNPATLWTVAAHACSRV